ncbi:uncharacterized protein LOC143915939 [Arctopsyche grandis]|uniref:uncharacterized protein LOC143915939 n=1 Tax=Arctopsyche grandis TaxID=121162 RepID=UPI00406D6A43
MSTIYLPTQFEHVVASASENGEEVKIYAALTNEECDDWVATYSELTSTKWNIQDTKENENNEMCRKIYLCHHASQNEAKECKIKAENLNCTAKITISIMNVNISSKLEHLHIRLVYLLLWMRIHRIYVRVDDGETHVSFKNLPALILIQNTHSHDTTSAEALGHLKPLDPRSSGNIVVKSRDENDEGESDESQIGETEEGDDEIQIAKIVVTVTVDGDEELNKKLRATLETVYNKFTSINLCVEDKLSYIRRCEDIINAPEEIGGFIITRVSGQSHRSVIDVQPSAISRRASNLQSGDGLKRKRSNSDDCVALNIPHF